MESVVNLVIKDLGNLKFGFVIDCNWQRWGKINPHHHWYPLLISTSFLPLDVRGVKMILLIPPEL